MLVDVYNVQPDVILLAGKLALLVSTEVDNFSLDDLNTYVPPLYSFYTLQLHIFYLITTSVDILATIGTKISSMTLPSPALTTTSVITTHLTAHFSTKRSRNPILVLTITMPLLLALS